MVLEKKFHTGPSFAVKFYPKFNHIWAAQGPFLKIYDQDTDELVHSCRIFSRNKIHGISFNDNANVLLYGSTSFAFISVDELYKSRDISEAEQHDNEWITSGEISDKTDTCYLLTCYNKVKIYDFNSAKHIETKALFQERSILYSGSIKIKSENKVIVCAGTVMGGVLIWDCYNEQLLHNLKGHEGSIFGAVCSDNFDKIASCSDDRTIRIWDVETGEQLCFAFGHTARIWSLKFMNNDTQLVSTSEDCTMRVWDIKRESGDSAGFVLEQSSVHEVHQIKSVWACDVLGSWIATTGNDGRVNITDLTDLGEEGRNLVGFSMEEITSSSDSDFRKKELFKSFQWYSFGLIVMTSVGRCFRYLSKTEQWDLLFEDESYSNYNSINSFQKVCIFTNAVGNIKLMEFDGNGSVVGTFEYTVKNRVSKVLNTLASSHGNTIYLLIESPNPKDSLQLLSFPADSLHKSSISEFAKPKNFPTSSFEIHEDLLIIGSRMSTLGIFKISEPQLDPKVIRNLTAGDNTTSVTFVQRYFSGNPIFSITNRDGFYNFVSIDKESLEFKVLHSNKIAKGFLQHGMVDSNGDYIITGFKSNVFHISNETTNCEIVNELCGGAHRQWKMFEKGTEKSEQLLAYSRGSLYLRTFANYLDKPQTMYTGLHGREIRDISIQPGQGDAEDILFVTGSEDTTIKVCSFNKKTGLIKQYWTQRKHVSGLQKLKFINSKYLLSCSAREELFLWELTRADDGFPFLNLVQAIPTISENPDLRVMDFDFIFNGDKKDEFLISTVYSDSSIRLWYFNNDQQFKLVLDGKYETCCLFGTALKTLEDKLVLIVTPTDGHVVYWDITEYIPFQVRDGHIFGLDGIIIDKDFQPEKLCSFLERFSVHQSGTKTLDIFRNGKNDGEFSLLTGGDDNSLGISHFKLDETNKVVGKNMHFVEKAAASTITSVNYFVKEQRNMCLVCSVDQDLRVWEINQEFQLTKVEEEYSTIADTNSIDIYNNELAVVGGVGCSIWKL